MNASFRFRYVNEIVGAFVLLTVALVAVGILFVGRAQRWFEPAYEILITFPEEGTFGLQKGAEVHLLGTPIGAVERIVVDDEGAMHARLRVRGQFIRFIRTDSVAVVKKIFGVAGDSYIEIYAGAGEPLPPDDAVLPVRKDTEITEMIQSIVEQVEGSVVPTLEEIQRTLAEFRGLAADLRAPGHDLQRSLAGVRAIIEGLGKGEGSAGRVLRDPTIALEIEAILARINALAVQLGESMGTVDRILEDVRGATAGLPASAEVVQAELRDIPGLVLQAQATLQETEQLLAGLQQHWLLRRYMDRPPEIEFLPPPAPTGGRP